MSSEQVNFAMSQLSLNSADAEDWDRSMSSDVDPNTAGTPRNSVSFPGVGADDGAAPARNGSLSRSAGKRTLSELLKLHAEEGTDVNFTPEEASRVAEVLGQWVSVRVCGVDNPTFIAICRRLGHGHDPSPSPSIPPPAVSATEVLMVFCQINSSSSPYEGEDDFFSRQHSQDDSSIPNRPSSAAADAGRPRGQSESVVKS